jgi:two-component system chemotaxis sensor kinase CheA
MLRDALRRLGENPAAPLDFNDELMMLECILAGETGDSAMVVAKKEKKEDFAYITQKSSTLKVNFEKLDELLNLVGELVIHRTTLFSLEAKLRDAVKEKALIEAFNEASQLIGKSAAELRESIMKVRMLPIKVVFQRFNRLVRDLSRRHDKEIRLVFEGEETELDKTVIDEIGEPLLHLIRNAVDHGFESPAERQRLDKPPVGTLLLKACHESNHIVVSVDDDGQGMSAERIREKAVEKGLLDAQEARSLSEQECFQLVFLPGFSTSSEVTETSGRGIGLDVVKKIVTSFNGIIEINSTPGSGTRFIIKLPLTLAIIQALMVEVSGETFAIPLYGVQESIRISASEFHEVGAGEMIKLRDRLLPIIRLDRWFGMRSSASKEMEYVVVVGSGEKRGGLVIDRLIGQQEVVIKALDDYLGELPGVAGGTVLGDGRISLILDIASLIGKNRGARNEAA